MNNSTEFNVKYRSIDTVGLLAYYCVNLSWTQQRWSPLLCSSIVWAADHCVLDTADQLTAVSPQPSARNNANHSQ